MRRGQTLAGLVRLLHAIPVWTPSTLRILSRDGLTFSALIAIAAAKQPHATALIDDTGSLTYADLETLVEEAAAHRPPDVRHVDVREPDRRTYLITVTAALRHNADAILHDPAAPAPPDTSGGAAGPATPAPPGPLEGSAGAPSTTSGVPPTIVGGAPGASSPVGGVGAFASVSASGVGDASAVRGRRRGQIVLMTSGSTGVPKAVERGRVRSAQVLPIATLVRLLPIRPRTPVVVTPPLFHGFGLGFVALGLAFGMPVVMVRRLEDVARFVRDHPGCLLVGVPPILARIERIGGPAAPGAVISGAGLLHPAVAARLTAAYGQVLFNLYGSSEEGWSTIATPRDLAEAPGTIGRPAAGVRVAVLDEAGEPLQAGEIGHLCVASRLEFAQYSGGERRPRLGGMADSGDLGHRDTAGRFFVDGRADDMVVTGGENVFPTEVENVLLGHPAVAEVRVDGVPDEEFGARLEAVVVLRAPADADELLAYARDRLAKAKVPRVVRFTDVLLTTSTGKHRRRVT